MTHTQSFSHRRLQPSTPPPTPPRLHLARPRHPARPPREARRVRVCGLLPRHCRPARQPRLGRGGCLLPLLRPHLHRPPRRGHLDRLRSLEAERVTLLFRRGEGTQCSEDTAPYRVHALAFAYSHNRTPPGPTSHDNTVTVRHATPACSHCRLRSLHQLLLAHASQPPRQPHLAQLLRLQGLHRPRTSHLSRRRRRADPSLRLLHRGAASPPRRTPPRTCPSPHHRHVPAPALLLTIDTYLALSSRSGTPLRDAIRDDPTCAHPRRRRTFPSRGALPSPTSTSPQTSPTSATTPSITARRSDRSRCQPPLRSRSGMATPSPSTRARPSSASLPRGCALGDGSPS